MNHYVYEITNLINGKKYIGKRSCKCKIDDDKYIGSGKYLAKAINKYESENFSKKIIEICDTESLAYESERIHIEKVKAYDNCEYYNLIPGGNGFSSIQSKRIWENEKHREKMYNVHKEMWLNDKYREKMKNVASETMKITMKELWGNEEYANRQKERCSRESIERWKCEDYRNIQIEKTKRMWENADTRDKIIKNMKKVYSTEESKSKRSYASKQNWEKEGYKEEHIRKLKYRWSNPKYKEKLSRIMKNKFKDENYRNKMDKVWEKQKKKVILLNNNKIFKSCIEASEYVGLESSCTITLCCQGNRLSAGKIENESAIWMYYQDYLSLDKDSIELKLNKGKKSRENSNLNLKDNSIKVICLNNGIVFDSLKNACKFVGLKSGFSISKCCNGISSYAGKINGEPAKWKYYDDYINNNK